ncbi:MAG: gamma-glutamyl-gamma-aminobutyrate hydrolase family protein [Actinobacteria bacterium]|nr:gamma-glutamyl-gamma-aminobutyrate hydrolase family protein [Actinomycetota bacterium]
MTAKSSNLHVLVIQNEGASPGGLINEWLDEQGADVEVLRIDVEDRDVDPRDYQLLVPLGSEFPAYDESRPFVERSRLLLERAVEEEVPVLGVCFGGQLLARVLGGRAFRAPTSEIGWTQVRSRDSELVSEGPWFQWHFDTFSIPPGARLIAENDSGPQAYVAGRHLGVQFHPEVTPEIMDEWVRTYRHELEDEGVDPDALLEETERRAEDSRNASWRLLQRYIDAVARLSSESVHGR